MSFDRKVPPELKEIQSWFAGVITQPIDQKSHIAPIAPSGESIEKEAPRYISPSPTLNPKERIELYNQQYWWRLLNILHTSFSLATRLLGYRQFNDTIATPYLCKYPSESYSLSRLGERLPKWMAEEYKGEDKQFLLDAIKIDEAFNLSFFAAHHPPITEGCKPEEVMLQVAVLQPHLFLLEMEYDLFKFRAEIKQKDPDFWSNHHFPNLHHALSEEGTHFPKLKRDHRYYFVIHRNLKNKVVWKEITEPEYALLNLFSGGSTIEDACLWLEKDGKRYLSEAKSHLQEWIQLWIAKQWLTGGEGS